MVGRWEGERVEHEIIEVAGLRAEGGRPVEQFVALARNERALVGATVDIVGRIGHELHTAPPHRDPGQRDRR